MLLNITNHLKSTVELEKGMIFNSILSAAHSKIHAGDDTWGSSDIAKILLIDIYPSY